MNGAERCIMGPSSPALLEQPWRVQTGCFVFKDGAEEMAERWIGEKKDGRHMEETKRGSTGGKTRDVLGPKGRLRCIWVLRCREVDEGKVTHYIYSCYFIK